MDRCNFTITELWYFLLFSLLLHCPGLRLAVLKFCLIPFTLQSLLSPGLQADLSSCRPHPWTQHWWYKAAASSLRSDSRSDWNSYWGSVVMSCLSVRLSGLGCSFRKLCAASACRRRRGLFPVLVPWWKPCPGFYTICPVQVRDWRFSNLPSFLFTATVANFKCM